MVRTLPFHGKNMGSIPIGDIIYYFLIKIILVMDSLIFKSFIPEIFLSVSILVQLIYNSRFINKLGFNYPVFDTYQQRVTPF